MKVNASLRISPRRGVEPVGCRLQSYTSISQQFSIIMIIAIGLLYVIYIPLGLGNIKTTIVSDNKLIDSDSDDSSSSVDINQQQQEQQIQQQPALAFVVLPIINACGDINTANVVCQITILFQDNEQIPLIGLSNTNHIESICQQVLAETTPFVQIPICVQNADVFGAVVTTATSAAKPVITTNNVDIDGNPIVAVNVNVVDNIQDEHIKGFIDMYVPNLARIIHLKKIDFPDYYKRVPYSPPTEDYWEPLRDSNYGNMVWRYAATTLLNPIVTQFNRNDRYSMTDLSDGPVDALIIATANTLHMLKRPLLQDFVVHMTDRIITRNVPTIVTGLGIQMDFGKDIMSVDDSIVQRSLIATNRSLPHEFQINFLQEARIRQTIPSIGVRGIMTKKICENSGINNCIATSCPSLTISRNTNLGKTIRNNWNTVVQRLTDGDKTLKIAVTAPAYNRLKKYTRYCLSTLAFLFDEFPGHVTLIEQGPGDWIGLQKFIDTRWTKTIRPTSKLNSTEMNHIEFYNVESWLANASQYDLCISFRIHGSMMFINSGVPNILIPTDFRIMELISSMKLPHLPPSMLQTAIETSIHVNTTEEQSNPDSGFNFLLLLMEMAKNTNFTEFEMNRRSKIQAWKTIVMNIGLEIDPALLRILASPL